MSNSLNTMSLTDVISDDTDCSLIKPSKYYSFDSFLNLIDTNNLKTKFSIFNSNARSLLKHKADFDLLFDSLLHTKNFAFDIITFNETWLNTDLENLAYFNDYSSVFKHKIGSKEGGGIAVYVKNHIKFQIRHDLTIDDIKRALYDCVFIEIDHNEESHQSNIKNTVIGVVYRSPSNPSIPCLIEDFSEILDKISNEDKNLILLGDLNIDLLQCNSNSQTTKFLDHLISFNLIPRVTLPTRITNSSATLIDHVFSNIHQEKSLAGTLLTDITDHLSNFMCFDISVPRACHPKYISYRIINERTLSKLNEALEQETWVNVFNSNNASTAYEHFLETYLEHVNQHLPVKQTRFKKHKHKIQTWMTQGLLKSRQKKEQLYVCMVKARSTENYLVHENTYKEYLSVYNRTIKAAKKHYYEMKFELTKSDMKQTWNNINEVLNRTSNKTELPSKFHYGDKTLVDNIDIANGFNQYFVDVGQALASKIKVFPGVATDFLPNRNLPHGFFLEPVTSIEIFNIINALKAKTSCGYDEISPKLLKQSAQSISSPLTHIANISFTSGLFPKDMKKAKVVPIFKNGNDSSFNNYRPISLLPAFSKIIERLMHRRLYKYLSVHKLLCMSQYGFQKHMSTEQAILEFQDRIVNSIASKKWCSGIFLDLSKAFDTLDHEILLSKLCHLGVRGIPLNWFKSYLSERSQFVEFKKYKSNCLSISCGVPQGSILGPLLFLVYINDIVDHIRNCNAILFADDTTIVFENHDFNCLLNSMNDNLNTIYKWLCLNKLSLNVQKTNYIIFHTPQRKLPTQPQVSIDGTYISHVKVTKFLGVLVDENMSWRQHCNIIANKCLKVTAILSRLKHLLPFHILCTIYNSLFLPHISYSITAWGNSVSKEAKRIITLQKKTIRHIFKKKYNSHSDPFFKKMNTLKVTDLFQLNCCKMHFKSHLGVLKPYFSNAWTTNSLLHNYDTRNATDAHQHNTTMKIQTQSLNYKVTSSWNSLPSILKNKNYSCIHSFTKQLKIHFISQYSDHCPLTDCYICNRS